MILLLNDTATVRSCRTGNVNEEYITSQLILMQSWIPLLKYLSHVEPVDAPPIANNCLVSRWSFLIHSIVHKDWARTTIAECLEGERREIERLIGDPINLMGAQTYFNSLVTCEINNWWHPMNCKKLHLPAFYFSRIREMIRAPLRCCAIYVLLPTLLYRVLALHLKKTLQ